jgi:hypothetical protein
MQELLMTQLCTPGDLTENTKEVDYMAGHCHVFAIALHRTLGLTFLVLLDKSEKYGPGIYATNHVYAVDKAGNAYDFAGKHSAANVEQQWLNPECSMSRPGIASLPSEAKLGKYVEPTEDGWSKPLAKYSETDVKRALEVAKERHPELFTQ